MGFWSIIQEALMMICGVVGSIFAFFIGIGLLIALVYWVVFLLEYPMILTFWMLEKILPPFHVRKSVPHRREPEPPPPIHYGPCINETPKPIQEAIKECLRDMNDEQVYTG